MPTLKLHYDGWIALPAGLRRALDLNSGDRLQADLVDGTLVLRPASGARSKRARAVDAEAAESVSPSPETLLLVGQAEEAAKPAGRVKKTAEGGAAAAPKRRGRPPKASVVAPPRPASHAPVGIGPAKLIKKGELEPSSAVQAVPPAPVARARPERITQSVERRPFRNVEVRALGPGRGHNSPRRLRPGS